MELADNKIRALAKICHEANRAFCESIGDTTNLPWVEAGKEVQDSAIEGVKEILENPDISFKKLHLEWKERKIEDGWVYGKIKDPEAKTHPCLVDYKKLPVAQRFKDNLFKSIVKSYIDFMTDDS